MAKTTFHPTSKNIGELLGGNERAKSVVPAFQRGYSWEKKHVAAFWKDIIDLQKDDSREKHFLGPIVILTKPRDVIEVLDGQQRLATATILFSVLRDIAQQKSSDTECLNFARDVQTQFILKEGTSGYSLDMGETDRLYFRESIQSFPAGGKKPTLRSHHKIQAAQRFLMDAVKRHVGSSSSESALHLLVQLKGTLRSDLVMTCIPVTSEQDAFWIFETLNDRGLRLSVPDLLLNYLMRVANPKTDRSTIRRLWNDMLERMGRRDITRFLRHLWVSKYGDLKDQDLFSALKLYIDKKRIKSLDFARACSADCASYVELLDAKEETLGIAAPYVGRLLKLDIQPSLPLLLASYQQCTLVDLEKIARWMLVFVIRHSIIAGLDSSELETIFFKLARTIRSVPDSDSRAMNGCLGDLKKMLIAASPTDDQIKLAMSSLILSPEEASYMLGRLANRMQTGTKEITLDESNVEHIFPKKPEESKWGGKANQVAMEQYLWHIGNLTMLGGRINSGMGNEEYPIKRDRYEKRSELKMAQAVARDYPTKWDKATIEDRATRLGQLVVEVWNFDNPSRV